jgi:hypothetical protein
MRIATGEIEQTIPDDGKDPAAKALGKKAARGAGAQQSHCIPLRLRGARPNALAASSAAITRARGPTTNLRTRGKWPRCHEPQGHSDALYTEASGALYTEASGAAPPAASARQTYGK